MSVVKIGNYNVALNDIAYIQIKGGLFKIHLKDSSIVSVRADNNYASQKIHEIADKFKSQNVDFIQILWFYIVKNCIKEFKTFVEEGKYYQLRIYFKQESLGYISTPWLTSGLISWYIERLK